MTDEHAERRDAKRKPPKVRTHGWQPRAAQALKNAIRKRAQIQRSKFNVRFW